MKLFEFYDLAEQETFGTVTGILLAGSVLDWVPSDLGRKWNWDNCRWEIIDKEGEIWDTEVKIVMPENYVSIFSLIRESVENQKIGYIYVNKIAVDEKGVYYIW